jgi:hypothetical protein
MDCNIFSIVLKGITNTAEGRAIFRKAMLPAENDFLNGQV